MHLNLPETIPPSPVSEKLVSGAKKKLVPGTECAAHGTLVNALREGSPRGSG